MRSGLIALGVIFLVLGGLFYFVPMQKLKADTTTTGNGETDIRTSSANITIPVEWAYTSLILGFVLLVLGLVIPTPVRRQRDNSRKDSYQKVVETRKDIESDDGNRHKIVRERTERTR